MTAEPLLEIENLRTSFDTKEGNLPAVDGISFEIGEGEIFGLVGESGSGKSVTALSITQLIGSGGTVEADAIRFKGEDLTEWSKAEIRNIRGSEISMIFQDPMSGLNPVMTIGEQVAEVVRHNTDSSESAGFWSEMRRKYVTGTPRESNSWKRAVELLETVGIPQAEKRAGEYPHQFSGGMRQRVMIAQALAADPSLIIADEPTTALDVSVGAQILNELLDLRDEFDVSVLLITHDLAVIRETCDRVAVMYAGELMERADVDVLFNNPQHPYTIGLLESIPRISDEREWLNAIEGTVPNLAEKPSGCPFQNRCEHAFELCDQPLEEHYVEEDNHVVRCHLHDEDVEMDDLDSASPTDGVGSESGDGIVNVGTRADQSHSDRGLGN